MAFLPQLVAFGLLLGAGEWTAARGALLVFVANLVCINLSIVLTLLARGIRPTGYDEEQKARRSTRLAIMIWTVLLLVLIGILWIA